MSPVTAFVDSSPTTPSSLTCCDPNSLPFHLMSNPSIVSVQSRLTSTSALLLERSRVVSLNLAPSASSTSQIVRNLTTIKSDIARIQDEQNIEDQGLALGGSAKKGKGKKTGSGGRESSSAKAIREAGERYDRLVEMLKESDNVGREKAKSLAREKSRPPTPPPPTFTINSPDSPASASSSSQPGHIPTVSIEPPTPSIGSDDPFRDSPAKPTRYRDNPENQDDPLQAPKRAGSSRGSRTDLDLVDGREGSIHDAGDKTPQDMLSEQQVLMDDQDERLNLLSSSIGRQNHLSIQIGSELDLHGELLEETDHAMDRTQDRLNRAKKRLDKVASNARQHGSTVTIVALIFVLLLLIIIFKT